MSEFDSFITVDKEELVALRRNNRILNALYAGGVESWVWYGEAMSTIKDDKDEEGVNSETVQR